MSPNANALRDRLEDGPFKLLILHRDNQVSVKAYRQLVNGTMVEKNSPWWTEEFHEDDAEFRLMAIARRLKLAP